MNSNIYTLYDLFHENIEGKDLLNSLKKDDYSDEKANEIIKLYKDRLLNVYPNKTGNNELNDVIILFSEQSFFGLKSVVPIAYNIETMEPFEGNDFFTDRLWTDYAWNDILDIQVDKENIDKYSSVSCLTSIIALIYERNPTGEYTRDKKDKEIQQLLKECENNNNLTPIPVSPIGERLIDKPELVAKAEKEINANKKETEKDVSDFLNQQSKSFC